MRRSVEISDARGGCDNPASLRRWWCTGVLLAGSWFFYAAPLPAADTRAGVAAVTSLETISPSVEAPVLELTGLDGTPHRLSDYLGRVVVVNFWSTWCMPCRWEMPSLERVWQRLRPSGVVVLGVAIQDEPEMVERFLGENPVSFPILLDSAGDVWRLWSFSGIPATFVVDKRGRIVYRAMGLREWDSDEIAGQLASLAEGE